MQEITELFFVQALRVRFGGPGNTQTGVLEDLSNILGRGLSRGGAQAYYKLAADLLDLRRRTPFRAEFSRKFEDSFLFCFEAGNCHGALRGEGAASPADPVEPDGIGVDESDFE